MIPDPQPRRTTEQIELEKQLATSPHLLERENEMQPLAIRATEALRDLLGEGALDVSFGVGEEHEGGQSSKPLPWVQLAEITKCLKVRDMLPNGISADDQAVITQHAAWIWFEVLRNPRLAFISMHPFHVHDGVQHAGTRGKSREPESRIYLQRPRFKPHRLDLWLPPGTTSQVAQNMAAI